MSEEETTSTIISYWTPERMAAVQPIPTVTYSTEHIEKEEAKDTAESDEQLQSKETVEASGPLQIVPDIDDAVLKTFPYQSVGKLYSTVVTPSGAIFMGCQCLFTAPCCHDSCTLPEASRRWYSKEHRFRTRIHSRTSRHENVWKLSSDTRR